MIIPIAAIDLIDGKVVRLRQGDFSQQTTYSADPLAIALELEKLGFKRLHLVDLDGARAGSVQQLEVLQTLFRNTGLLIDFGGGVQTESEVERILETGARQVTIGSLAVHQPEKLQGWINRYGADKFLLAADVKDGYIVTKAWTTASQQQPADFLDFWQQQGVQEIFLTEVRRDGALAGPAIDFYRQLCQDFPTLQIIASGGVRGPGDVVALGEAGCAGVIIGKALYEQAVPRMRWIELLQKGTYAG